MNVMQVVHVPVDGDTTKARVICPRCKVVQPLTIVGERRDRCCDDVQCQKCGHEWRVEWPD